jgi:hypothetical protein
MSERIITLLFLLGTSTFCWIMVLRPSARQNLSQHGYRTWRMSKDERETSDALQFVGFLFGAVILSIITLTFIYVRIFRLGAR